MVTVLELRMRQIMLMLRQHHHSHYMHKACHLYVDCWPQDKRQMYEE